MKLEFKILNPWYWIHKILPRTLFARSLLIIVVPVLLLQIVSMSVFVDNHWRKVTSRLAFGVAGEIAILAQEIEKGADENRLNQLSNYAAQSLDLLVTFEPNATMTPEIVTHGTWEPFTVRALSKALKEQVRRPYSLSLSPDDDWVNIGIQLDNGVLRVLALERRLFSSSAYIFLLWLGGSSIILFTIAVAFMRNQIRPIRKLALAAERMGTGKEIISFKPEGAREVRQAGRAFLEMHERITRQIEQRTTMLAGISHDLRTPLTRLKLGLSFLGENEDIKALQQDVTDMERMVNSYLDFVRGDGEEEAVTINFIDLLSKVTEITKRHGTDITLSAPDTVRMTVRPLAMERCLSNIVGNAEKFATKIVVTITVKDQMAYLRIEDNGPGVAEDKFEDIFKPFFKVDASRSKSAGGVGLGLSIARDIIHIHGGHITPSRSDMGGLCLEINLPV
ncbi:MAG: ATP-binding protein [Pseudobdellovibrionaceae bacterium]|jgi:two-component system osmolarity sensor histidine kinase EnvZ|nr:ATP-binding protein [Pseudobdellovibrionaceae bacterium]